MLATNAEMFQTLAVIRLQHCKKAPVNYAASICIGPIQKFKCKEQTLTHGFPFYRPVPSFMASRSTTSLTDHTQRVFIKVFSNFMTVLFPDQESYNHRKLYPSYRNNNLREFF